MIITHLPIFIESTAKLLRHAFAKLLLVNGHSWPLTIAHLDVDIISTASLQIYQIIHLLWSFWNDALHHQNSNCSSHLLTSGGQPGLTWMNYFSHKHPASSVALPFSHHSLCMKHSPPPLTSELIILQIYFKYTLQPHLSLPSTHVELITPPLCTHDILHKMLSLLSLWLFIDICKPLNKLVSPTGAGLTLILMYRLSRLLLFKTVSAT